MASSLSMLYYALCFIMHAQWTCHSPYKVLFFSYPSDLMKSTVVDESLSSMNLQFCSRENQLTTTISSIFSYPKPILLYLLFSIFYLYPRVLSSSSFLSSGFFSSLWSLFPISLESLSKPNQTLNVLVMKPSEFILFGNMEFPSVTRLYTVTNQSIDRCGIF